MSLNALSPSFSTTRSSVRHIAVHVLARARHAVVHRIDLLATPGGVGTPAFGADHRVIRLAGDALIVETTAEQASSRWMTVSGSTLAALAAFADANLEAEFSAGHDTPPLGDIDEPFDIDGSVVEQLGDWFNFGCRVIDAVVVGLQLEAKPTRARIWPEHFDLGIDVASTAGRRLNLGASPGDEAYESPYLYVAPWDADRPGDPAFWNAKFGAVLGYDELLSAHDPIRAGVAFLQEGRRRFD